MPRAKPRFNSDYRTGPSFTFSADLRQRFLELDKLIQHPRSVEFIDRLQQCVSAAYCQRPVSATRKQEIEAAKAVADVASRLAGLLKKAPEELLIVEGKDGSIVALWSLCRQLSEVGKNARAFADQLKDVSDNAHRHAFNEKPAIVLARGVADAMRRVLGVAPKKYATDAYGTFRGSLYAHVLRLLLKALQKNGRAPSSEQIRGLMDIALQK